jgi:cell division protein FtsW (lipid II flippase)
MNQDKYKEKVVTRALNLVVCVVFLCISIHRVDMNQWGSYWIWIWGLLFLLNVVLLVILAIHAKDLKNKE